MDVLSLIGVLILGLRGPSHAPEVEPLEVTARLVQVGGEPYCGWVSFATVSLYDEIEVISGEYSQPLVQVIHGCGSALGELRIGDRHRMRLVDASHSDLGVVEPLRMEKAGRYFCERGAPATKERSQGSAPPHN